MSFIKISLLVVAVLWGVVYADSSNDFVDKEITSFVKQHNVPAVSVGIIKNGEITFEKAYGTQSRENKAPVTTRSLFQIGSQSKVITSLLTLALVEDGKLKLDDPIDNLLPGLFASIDKTTLHKMTIDTLLSHRSGLPNYPENVTRVDGDAMEGGYAEAQLLAALKAVTLDFEPGSKFAYSNFNYAVMGYILSKKTGKSYETLVEEYLTDRLGVDGFYAELTASQQLAVVTPYRKDNRELATKAWDMGLLAPHGGLYSSTNSLTKLMQQQLAMYAGFIKNKQKSPFISTQASYATGLYPGLNYGYGMFEATPELGLYPQTVFWHGGDLDGFGCEYIFSPDAKTGIVLLTSSGGREFVMLGRKLMQNLLTEKTNALKPASASE